MPPFLPLESPFFPPFHAPATAPLNALLPVLPAATAPLIPPAAIPTPPPNILVNISRPALTSLPLDIVVPNKSSINLGAFFINAHNAII